MTYAKNLGMQEMIRFYQVASAPQIAEMEKVADESNWTAYKQLILKVLGITLK